MASPITILLKPTRLLFSSLNRSPLLYTSLRRPTARHSFSIEDGTKSLMNFPKFGEVTPDEYDPGRWVCRLSSSGLEFKSEQHVLDKYVQLVAQVVGGSEYEAKKRIYFVSHGSWGRFGFGAKIDMWQAAKLMTCPDIAYVRKDVYVDLRNNCEEPIRKFTPLNWNGRLENMFDYYKSNSDECNNNATGGDDSGHWLINISIPDGISLDDVDDYCVQLLAELVGSEEEAIKKIYVIWSNGPYGFGAEIDKEISKKLQEHPNVLQVLQDNSFDIKDKDQILYIFCWEGLAEPIISYYPKGDTYEDDSDVRVSVEAEDTA